MIFCSQIYDFFFGFPFILYCKIALHCIFAKFEGGEKWVNNR